MNSCYGGLFLLGCLACLGVLFGHVQFVPKVIPSRELSAKPPESSNSRSNEREQEEKHEAPLFVLNVGPPKTGTSTIQRSTADLQVMLQKDNFYYLGNVGKVEEQQTHELVRNCRDGLVPDCQEKWDQFAGIVQDHFVKGHNVFMSEELLNVCTNDSDEQAYLWDHLDPILQQGWRVRIVFTYRRLIDWIPSKYHQAYARYGLFRGRDVKWPDEGGRDVESFSHYFHLLTTRRSYILPMPIKKRWQERYADVRVFNLDKSDYLLRDFYCETMPEMKQTCQHLQSHDMSSGIANPSSRKAFHFDMIGVGARKRGWVGKHDKMSRFEVSRAIEAHAKEAGISRVEDFPLECLSSDEAQTLLDYSLSFEKELLPKYYESSHGEQEHKAIYATHLEDGKFCSVDVDETLSQPLWKKFFKDLAAKNEEETES